MGKLFFVIVIISVLAVYNPLAAVLFVGGLIVFSRS